MKKTIVMLMSILFVFCTANSVLAEVWEGEIYCDPNVGDVNGSYTSSNDCEIYSGYNATGSWSGPDDRTVFTFENL